MESLVAILSPGCLAVSGASWKNPLILGAIVVVGVLTAGPGLLAERVGDPIHLHLLNDNVLLAYLRLLSLELQE